MSKITKRSISLSGHATSVSLETEFWQALKCIAEEKEISLTRLIETIDVNSLPAEVSTPSQKQRRRNLSSTLRVYALLWFQRGQIHTSDL